MNRDKQIKQMTNVYKEARTKSIETIGSMNEGAGVWYAKAFYTAGYRLASDVAREIFEEILNEIDKVIDFTADSRRIRFELCQQKDIDPYKDRFFNVFDGKYNCVIDFGKYIAKLKKKYTEGEDTNVPTKESEDTNVTTK